MARLNVYLPDDLASAAKRLGLNLSALTQQAVRQQVAVASTSAWLAQLGPGPASAVDHDQAAAALDAVRDEPATRHG